MLELLAVRLYQRELSMIKLAEDGNGCNDKAGLRQ